MRNKEKDKLWREQNKERLSLYNKEWKEINKERLDKYRLENKDKLLETSKNWQKENKERAKANHKRHRDNNRELLNKKAIIYREENKENLLSKRRINSKRRKDEDPIYKFTENLRSLISISFKGGKREFKKSLRTEVILGCTIDFFKDYILSLCPEGIGLRDFHRHGYQLDHKIPISLAKTEEEVIKLCHYTNFQPLFWIDNIKKSNKLES